MANVRSFRVTPCCVTSGSVMSCRLMSSHVISYHGEGWKECDPRTLGDQYSRRRGRKEERRKEERVVWFKCPTQVLFLRGQFGHEICAR